MTFVSWKTSAAFIRLQTIELKVSRQFAAILPQARKYLARGSGSFHLERTCTCDMNLYVIAFLQLQRVNNARRQPYCEAIPPLRHLHRFSSSDIHSRNVYPNS